MNIIKTGTTLLFLGLLIVQTSCQKDFLDLKPNNSITDENFYQTQDDAIRATNAIYTPVQGLYNGAGWQILDIMSDNSVKGGGGANDGPEVQELDQFTLTSANPMILTYYTQCYQGIQRANIVLDKVPGIPDVSNEIRNRCLGEAYFLRGYYYYMLVRLFGDVPFYTSPIKLDESFVIPRTPAETIYTSIYSDLRTAGTLLPKTRYAGDDRGRVNAWAAKGMLASAYLTRSYITPALKDSAAKYALEVINSGIHRLTTNYADNYDYTRENNEEALFQVQYRNGTQEFSFYGQGAVMNTFMAPRAQNIVPSSGYGFNVPTPEFVAKYERSTNGQIIDGRRAATMWMPGDRFGDYVQPAQLEGSPNGYNVRKYFISITRPDQDGGGWRSALNVNVLRYAEVLLIAAEAKGASEGLQYINQVRTRAGLANLQTGLSDADYLEKIYTERQLEMSFEMNRWFDLIRHPSPTYMVSTMNAQGLAARDIHKLMPIPQTERDKNPNLTQNPGY
jgi:starch-binding outer membrane protein, SusD/RagB family